MRYNLLRIGPKRNINVNDLLIFKGVYKESGVGLLSRDLH
jgi:hypothetical protein